MNKLFFMSNINKPNDLKLDPKWTALRDIISKMLISQPFDERPTCAQLLSQLSSWDITINEVKESKSYQKNMNQLKQFSNQFFNNYFEVKIK